MQGIEQRDQEKIRQQFDYVPYPWISLEESPKSDYERLFQHSLVTAYYIRHRKVIDTQNKLILDAGCGAGWKSLALAEANPGAKVIGIDLSQSSLHLARQRLEYHGFKNTEFHQLKIEDIAHLGLEFDYINCDEVLYLLPDPVAGLQALKSVLKPDGIIRANLHNYYQRAHFYRAQKLFKLLGLMDQVPEQFEEATVLETMRALKDTTCLKVETWLGKQHEEKPAEKLKEFLAMNFLFIGDTGYTIPELFALLEQANLEFMSMVAWRHWDVTELFNDPENLPFFWGMSLDSATLPEKLHLFELLHPVHRLMDFWCTHPRTAGVAVDEWDEASWQSAIVHLHPQLRDANIKENLINCIQTGVPFEISTYIRLPALAPVLLESNIAACLLPLWQQPQPIQVIAERYRQLHPVDPITLEPLTETTAFQIVKALLNRLDAFLYVLIEA